VPARRSRNGV